VGQGQQARDSGASPYNPSQPFQSQAQPTQFNNADDRDFDFDTGTDARSRNIATTQANPPPTARAPIDVGSGIDPLRGDTITAPTRDFDTLTDDATPTNTRGIGAPNEDAVQPAQSLADSGGSSQTTAQAQLANRTDRAITAQPNILDKFASYTYTISIYLMSPEDYQTILGSKRRYIPPNRLLIQSAGAPSKVAGTVSTGFDAQTGTFTTVGGQISGRNQFFPDDFYIDDLEIRTINPGKGTGGAHNVTELKFKIVEPNGLTLLTRLNQAVRAYIAAGGASVGTVNGQFGAQNYLMVIRFYGYDANGNQLTAQQISSIDPTRTDKTDVNAIVEKFIPFQFSGIKFRIANRLVEYNCEAVAVPHIIGSGQARGVIPYNVQLSATTLENLFNGNAGYVNTQNPDLDTRDNAQGSSSAPDKASAAPTPTITQGLAQALNRYQQELVTRGVYTYPDTYKIVISHPEIASSSVVPPGPTDRKSKPMSNSAQPAQRDSDRQFVQNSAKTVSIVAGTSIVQFLDQAVQRSEYIYQQQTKIKSTDNNGKEIDVVQNTGGRAFAWYTINLQATPRGTQYFDAKRNDYAYDITYEIAPYGVNQVKSEYFPKGRFRGVQKRYAYWFTGENTSVLEFEQDFNYLYYITVNSRQAAPIPLATFNYAVAEKRVFSPNSAQSNQGIEGNVNEPAANAADYLYSPGDQGRVNLTILGDPAWIAQGTVWSGVRSTRRSDYEQNDVYFDAFLSDGTINYDAREVLFEIVFNTPRDYDLATGQLRNL
jgi:phage anti-repressor protein